ncbi:MFS transporter (plasmid) [Halorarum halophilum]|uniref:MFS transporter n=1 Tax=Halorarum halophilum TaxID=2743090 RepID=A0A7D5KAG3_9EURY|nr:MFS transporter [Halobaculum halophilum]QLG29894.1 MFS transporter [Halobaculum halophilum]
MAPSFTSRIFSVSNPRKLWLVTGAHAVNEFYSIALPPILPLLVNDFAISYGEAGVLLTVFFVTYSIFQLPAGVLADRIGQRWLLAAGMVTLSTGIFIAAGAQGYGTLVFAEALAGIGGSTYHPTGMSLISDLETGDTEGKAMGIHGLGGVVGTALAPALIGSLAALFDWRLALTVSAIVGIAYTATFLVLFRDTDTTDNAAPTEPDGGDSPKVETKTTTEGPERRWSQLASLLPVPLERWVAVLFLANLAIATEIGAVRTFVTSYLVEHAGMTTVVANGIFFVMLVGAAISSVGGGTLADTVDRRSLGFVTMVVSTVILGATALIPLVPVALFAWFFLLGIVLWAAIPAMNAITSQYSEQEFSGSLFGVMLTAGSLGGAGGPLLFGVAAERFGLGAAFPFVASVSIVGAVSFLAMRRF